MATIFTGWQARKEKVRESVKRAADYGWIDSNRQHEILSKLDDDVLTIGVIGQMKSGKSTFLNAFVFEEDILPAAVTPMTAALSVITYGKEKKIVAELYSKEEWEEQLYQASRSLEDVIKEEERLKIQAAKELVAQANENGLNLNSLLGKTREDTFDNLIEYVGAKGKYVSITKSVTIYYPNENLKGVQLVDTPGFNDPIVSREERSKEFLKNADAVVVLLYAGMPFSSVDRSILFKHVRSCGIGKVIIGVNKYDIPVENGDLQSEMVEYISSQIRRACDECGDTRLASIMEDATPILFSAQMALLSEMPMRKIQETEEYDFAWNRCSRIFEISNSREFREKSQIDLLTAAVLNVIEKEKAEILLRKPINAILAVGANKLTDINRSISECRSKIAVYRIPDDDLTNRRDQTDRAARRIRRKIDNLSYEIEESFNQLERRFRREIEDLVSSECNRAKREVMDLSILKTSVDDILRYYENFVAVLVQRMLLRCVEDQLDKARHELSIPLDDFFNGINDVLQRYMPDMNQRDISEEAERKIRFSVDDIDSIPDTAEEEGEQVSIKDIIVAAVDGWLTGVTFGVYGMIRDICMVKEAKKEMCKILDNLVLEFPVDAFISTLTKKKQFIISQIADIYENQLLNPILKSFEEATNNLTNRQEQLEKFIQEEQNLLSQREILKRQFCEINELVK